MNHFLVDKSKTGLAMIPVYIFFNANWGDELELGANDFYKYSWGLDLHVFMRDDRKTK